MSIEWIRQGLKKPGKTQAGLARALGIAQPGIARLVKGERRLKADEIGKAARYLEMEPPSEYGALLSEPSFAKAQQWAAEIARMRPEPLNERDLAWLAVRLYEIMRGDQPE